MCSLAPRSVPGWGGACGAGKQSQWPKFEHFSHSAHQGHLSWGLRRLNLFPGSLLPLQAGKFQALAPSPTPSSLCHILEQRPRVRATFPATCPRPSLSTLRAWPLSPPPTTSPSCPLSGISISCEVNCTWHVLYLLHSFIAFVVLTQALIRVCVYYGCVPGAEQKWGCVANSVRVPAAQGHSRAPVAPNVGQMEAIPVRWGPSMLSWLCHGGHMGLSFLLLKSPWKSAASWGYQALLFSRNK